MLNPLDLQKLMDGEQDSDLQNRILQLAEENPDCWRTIALAFIEDQQFQLGFVSNLDSKENGADEQSQPESKLMLRRASNLSSWSRWFVIAALVAVASALGFQLGQTNLSTGGSSAGVGAPEKPDKVKQDSSIELHDEQPESSMDDLYYANLSFQDAQGNSVPLVDYQQGQKYINQRLPEQTRTDLIRSGYDVNENIRYISGRLEGGQQILFP